jgi:hypothetical protein
MTVVDKTKPDVLRVTEYILEQTKINTTFSVASAAKSPELNGINNYRIAQIMQDICLDPEEPGSLIRFTTIDGANMDNIFCRWQLNAMHILVTCLFNLLSKQRYQTKPQLKHSG